MKRDYSIYIRTLGKGGVKYQKLLDSINSQTFPPTEVVVVLPNGYVPPKEKLGYERFAFSEKGMVRQRLFAINDVKTPYVLLLDDDVEFEPLYVEKMFATMERANAQCCIPILKDSSLHETKLKMLINRFIGYVAYKKTNDHFYMKINKCGGFSIKTNLSPSEQYYSQTGHGSNCFVSVKAIKNIHFEDDLWLEDSGYPLPEDQVMFYKLYLHGCNIAICQNVYFCHLDAASTNNGQRYLNIARAKAGNNLIFWYKYIYSYQKGIRKLYSILCIVHRMFWECTLYVVKHHNVATVKSCLKGLRFGLLYIKQQRFMHIINKQ